MKIKIEIDLLSISIFWKKIHLKSFLGYGKISRKSKREEEL